MITKDFLGITIKPYVDRMQGDTVSGFYYKYEFDRNSEMKLTNYTGDYEFNGMLETIQLIGSTTVGNFLAIHNNIHKKTRVSVKEFYVKMSTNTNSYHKTYTVFNSFADFIDWMTKYGEDLMLVTKNIYISFAIKYDEVPV